MTPWQHATILGARNVADTAAWYCRELGFSNPEGVYQGTEEKGGIYAVLHRGDVMLHLQIRRRNIHPLHRSDIESEVYIYVDNAIALFDSLRDRDLTILRPPAPGPGYDLIDFIVADPEGNRLIFGSPK